MAGTDDNWIHHQAGLAAQFEAQDNGKIVVLERTAILGKLPNAEVWIVRCDFSETDTVASGEYWWSSHCHLAVYKQENGEPISRKATEEEIALFKDVEEELDSEDDEDEDEE